MLVSSAQVEPRHFMSVAPSPSCPVAYALVLVLLPSIEAAMLYLARVPSP
jgi:hypothetical protein